MNEPQQFEELEKERERLILPRFDETIAWRLGCHIRERAHAGDFPIAIEVSRLGGRLFFCAMPGAVPDNEAWVRRKRNVVERFHESSLYMCRKTEAEHKTLIERYLLSAEDYVHSGGGVAIRVAGLGCVGAVTVSGLSQFEDHRLGAEALAAVISGLGK